MDGLLNEFWAEVNGALEMAERRRRGQQGVYLTFRRLMQQTQSLRAEQNRSARPEFHSSRVLPRNKQLIMKFRSSALTPGESQYRQTIVLHQVRFSREKDDDHPVRVIDTEETPWYVAPVRPNENPVSIRCSCKDWYFMWWKWVSDAKSLVGPKMPPYQRKTPPPEQGGYPYRNPDEIPGMCKHVIRCFRVIQSTGIMER